MRPLVPGWGLSLFLFCLILHITLWRIKTLKASTLILIAIFLLFPPAVLLAVARFAPDFMDFSMLSGLEIIEALFFEFSLSLVYISSYPAVRAVSPSLDILLMVSCSKDRRMTEKEIIRHYTDTTLVKARIDDLLVYRLISVNGDYFRLSPLAEVVILVFIYYRKILGLPPGEG